MNLRGVSITILVVGSSWWSLVLVSLGKVDMKISWIWLQWLETERKLGLKEIHLNPRRSSLLSFLHSCQPSRKYLCFHVDPINRSMWIELVLTSQISWISVSSFQKSFRSTGRFSSHSVLYSSHTFKFSSFNLMQNSSQFNYTTKVN